MGSRTTLKLFSFPTFLFVGSVAYYFLVIVNNQLLFRNSYLNLKLQNTSPRSCNSCFIKLSKHQLSRPRSTCKAGLVVKGVLTICGLAHGCGFDSSCCQRQTISCWTTFLGLWTYVSPILRCHRLFKYLNPSSKSRTRSRNQPLLPR